MLLLFKHVADECFDCWNDLGEGVVVVRVAGSAATWATN
jgi:hypothetical protein